MLTIEAAWDSDRGGGSAFHSDKASLVGVETFHFAIKVAKGLSQAFAHERGKHVVEFAVDIDAHVVAAVETSCGAALAEIGEFLARCF